MIDGPDHGFLGMVVLPSSLKNRVWLAVGDGGISRGGIGRLGSYRLAGSGNEGLEEIGEFSWGRDSGRESHGRRVFAAVIVPEDADGRHVRGGCGGGVGRAVADIDGLLGVGIEEAAGLEKSAGGGFGFFGVVFADDDGEVLGDPIDLQDPSDDVAPVVAHHTEDIPVAGEPADHVGDAGE